MAWQDRSYYRDQDSSSSGNPLIWLLSGSVPLYTAFGIRVRMHASLLILLILGVLNAALSSGVGFLGAVVFYPILFVIILLHEYGHCFAARWMGGDANEIMMWPLGGLAMASAPNRPWPQLVTTVGGPLVNLIICAVTAIVALALGVSIPLVPLPGGLPLGLTYVQLYCWYIYQISWSLFVFNLLPIFPMDGGRMLQELLWFKIGYYRSMLIACTVGMIGSVCVGVWGLTHFLSWYGLMLILLSFSTFRYCQQTRAMMKAEGPWAFEEENNDYSAAMWKPDEVDEDRVKTKKKTKRLSRRAVKKLRKQAQAEEAEQANLDAILAKVSAQGMQSLTWRERRVLHKATQRQREVEVTRDLD